MICLCKFYRRYICWRMQYLATFVKLECISGCPGMGDAAHTDIIPLL